MRSLYSAASGMSAHQTAMDVIGNNISNINTTGFKSSSTTFAELFSQTLKGASSSQDGSGGTNAQQVGLGVAIGSTKIDMESGSIESTGNSTDLALDDDGFFIVNNGEQDYYTRAGSFSFDEEGYLTSSTNGYYVQGWQAGEQGGITTDNSSIDNLKLDTSMEPSATTTFSFSGNLDSTLTNELNLEAEEMDVEDSDGNTDTVSIELTQTGSSTWTYSLSSANSNDFQLDDGTSLGSSISGEISFNEDGEIEELSSGVYDLLANNLEIDLGGTDTVELENHSSSFSLEDSSLFASSINDSEIAGEFEFNTNATLTADVYDAQGNSHTVTFETNQIDENSWEISAADLSVTDADAVSLAGEPITLTFDDSGNLVSSSEIELSFTPDGLSDTQSVNVDFSEVTQYADDTDISVSSSDGYGSGSLESVSFTENGILVGSYDNGYSKSLAQIAVGTFSNSSGLLKSGDTLYQKSSNSGEAVINPAGTGGASTVQSGSLEASNVDLAQEFSDMIKVQRGYQGNSSVITTTDEMLQTLINLKR